jgi:putative hemolysin
MQAMKKTATIVALALLGTLAACGSAPQKLNPTPEGVSYSFDDGDDLGKVTNQAMAYCQGIGKTAKLKNVSQADGKSIAIFDCNGSHG